MVCITKLYLMTNYFVELVGEPTEVKIGNSSVTLFRFHWVEEEKIFTYILLREGDLPPEGKVSSSVNEELFERMEELVSNYLKFGY